MSYNQSFTPQSGQGNLSAQFGASQHYPASGGSAPRDIPGRTRRQSSVSSSYGSYPPPQAGYGATPPGGYGGSPGTAYSRRGSYATGPYAKSPSQQMAPPPNQMPMYGASPTNQQPGGYGTSLGHLHPVSSGPPPGTGWQNPAYAPSSHPPASYSEMAHRHSSSSSYQSRRSSDTSEKKHKSKRRTSAPTRYESPRRPTMTDSVLAAWGGLKGAFDRRK
jgi:hypothetical protein